MNAYNISVILIAVATFGLSLWDLVPALNSVDGDTISRIIRAWSREWPILAYLWGLLGGHFFLGYSEALTNPRGDLYLTLWVTWAAFILNLWYRSNDVEPNVYIFAVAITLGLLVGSFFWSQA
jgi:hypothetical protein